MTTHKPRTYAALVRVWKWMKIKQPTWVIRSEPNPNGVVSSTTAGYNIAAPRIDIVGTSSRCGLNNVKGTTTATKTRVLK